MRHEPGRVVRHVELPVQTVAGAAQAVGSVVAQAPVLKHGPDHGRLLSLMARPGRDLVRDIEIWRVFLPVNTSREDFDTTEE